MVKRSENGVITNPFWLAPGHTLGEADALMAKYPHLRRAHLRQRQAHRHHHQP